VIVSVDEGGYLSLYPTPGFVSVLSSTGCKTWREMRWNADTHKHEVDECLVVALTTKAPKVSSVIPNGWDPDVRPPPGWKEVEPLPPLHPLYN
jgi:hypothetical protein